ncbi:MAG: hypothetical protein LBH92_04090 [Bacteroidales bacterium]|jgi:beta-N-acetylhexosaminidase|nr:hypothetical protein [Bacteroidales bacterium]
MMKKLFHLKTILFILAGLLSFTVCSQNEITLQEKAAQMIMVGFRGTEIDKNHPIAQDIQELKIGGVILFEYDVPSKSRPRNIQSPQQLQNLCKQLQDISSEKLFIAIDQEGGYVNRLKTNYGFPKMVSAQYLGTIDQEDSTRFYAKKMSETLAECGINLNFAPCVDLNINTKCPVIGKIERSFSADENIVVKHASIFVEEHRKNRILSCLKHFPGHGSSAADSHDGFTDVTHSWREKELIPYRKMIQEGMCDAVMSSHVFNANLDPVYPGTLSQKIIIGILRDSLGWQGCVISDDMNMGAITENFGFKESIAWAINAGIDILTFSNNSPDGYDPKVAQKVLNAIIELVAEKTIPEQRINESYQRIQQLKSTIN